MSFFLNDTATTEIYTLSLHDALPIYRGEARPGAARRDRLGQDVHDGQRHRPGPEADARAVAQDRKSTRLNSSHLGISYAVFCLKKKKNERTDKHDGRTITI